MLTYLILISLISSIPVGWSDNAPSQRMGNRMIYDPINEKVILIGGAIWSDHYTFYNDLWSFDPVTHTWEEITTSVRPSGRFNHMMVYLPDRHQVFLFGGFSARDRIGDTWLYDIEGNMWTQLHPTDTPSMRSDAAIAYDEENRVVVLFGGYGNNEEHPDDTWVYDFVVENWVQMNPETKPLQQYGCHMVYDSLNQRLLFYPGHWSTRRGSTLLTHGYGDQVWVYDYADDDWTELNTSPKPEGRYWFNLAYDTGGQMILFGGSGGGNNMMGDTWLYDYMENTWEQVDSDVTPSGRSCSSMVYDSVNDLVVMFGGSDNGASDAMDDTWILDMEIQQWSLVEETTTSTTDSSEESEPPENRIPGLPFEAILLGVSFFVLSRRWFRVN
ncbi:MAG: hypothetical protein NWE89_15630 [Candidatus Bathyarchaeota archaeon]|nr:hypothetical protein [Candidatus Bathyarchaeota archaeon]